MYKTIYLIILYMDKLDRLKAVLESKIKKTRNDINNELHNKAYNDSLQNEIRTLEWVLEYIGKNAQTDDDNNLEVAIENKIAELAIRMDKATHREVTDFLFTKLETL